MTNIVFFVNSMQSGGAERVAANLCNRWVKNGHLVILVLTFSGRGTSDYILQEGVRVIHLADLVRSTRRTIWTSINRLYAMRKIMLEHRADVAISFHAKVNIAALIATFGLRTKLVISERTFPPAINIGPVWQLLRKFTYPLAARVVMQTPDGYRWLKITIPRADGVVIPNPCVFPLPEIAKDAEPDTVIPKNQNLLLAVGRLVEEKQFNVIISAFSKLSHKFLNWDLAIVGEGPERSSLTRLIIENNLERRVHLPGRSNNLGKWYHRADIYVMASRFEGFPNSLLEALAYGLPSVSFDCETGPSDLIKNNINGFLIPTNTGVAGLTEHLELLMSNAEIRAKFASNAIQVRSDFSLKKVGFKWDCILGINQQQKTELQINNQFTNNNTFGK